MAKSGKRNTYLILGAGLIGGMYLYHVLGKQVDKVWNKVPYLNTVHSNFAVSNYGGEI